MDYSHWGSNAAIVLATLVLVMICLVLHYEGLNWLAHRLGRREGPRRPRVVYAVGGALLLHITEIWIYGLGLWSLLHLPQAGMIQGAGDSTLLDAVYLSAVTYTTVGFGDVVPLGSIRFAIGTEALMGLLLITWSASFTYLEMERNWRGH